MMIECEVSIMDDSHYVCMYVCTYVPLSLVSGAGTPFHIFLLTSRLVVEFCTCMESVRVGHLCIPNLQ